MNSNSEKVAYSAPVVSDHGSIADHTFGGDCRWVRRGFLNWERVCTPAPGLSSTF